MMFVASCISVSLPESKTIRSEKATFNAPPAPYAESKEPQLDAYWSNSKNGNSISVLSDCSKNSDPSLLTITKGIIGGIEEAKIVSSQESLYNHRAALRSLIDGRVDGVPTKVKLTVFKKNGCIYILTYVALEKHFSSDELIFSNFELEFKVP